MIYEIEISTRTDYWAVYAPKEEYEKFKDKLSKGNKYIEVNGVWGESVCVKADEVIGVDVRKQEEVIRQTLERVKHPVINDIVDMYIFEFEGRGYRHDLTLARDDTVELIFTLKKHTQ